MKTRLQRWGNSLGLRIPKVLAQQAAIEAGSMVELTIDERRRLVVAPVPSPSYQLDDLLAGITDQNLHRELETGAGRGRKAW